MNKTTAAFCLLAAAVAGAQAQTFTDRARVRSVDPQYENVAVPRNECTSRWVNETQRVGPERQYGGAVVGGLAGAILGNQVGGGHGKQAATAVGAVVGAMTGDRLSNGYAPEQYVQAQREVRECRNVSELQQRLTGYRVQYEYHGQNYSTLMRENPGATLPVRVSVEPLQAY
jgi:uncharacterized protein YcfJ